MIICEGKQDIQQFKYVRCIKSITTVSRLINPHFMLCRKRLHSS